MLRYLIKRTSDSGYQPCDEARIKPEWGEMDYVERPFYPMADWYADIDDILEFARRYGRIVIRQLSAEEINEIEKYQEYKGIEFEIEIYDSWRE